VSAEDLLCGAKPIPETKSAQADALLRELLLGGERLCADIYAASNRLGIGKRTMEAAKQALGVKSVKRAAGWCWKLDG
jgi:hypothetical protein